MWGFYGGYGKLKIIRNGQLYLFFSNAIKKNYDIYYIDVIEDEER